MKDLHATDLQALIEHGRYSVKDLDTLKWVLADATDLPRPRNHLRTATNYPSVPGSVQAP
jgi:hypothetical protein